MSSTLNGIRKALENNLLPVVNYDKEAAAHFYEPSYGENVWEYYFEPVMGIGYDRVMQLLDNGETPQELVHVYKSRWQMDLTKKDHLEDPNFITTFWVYLNPENPAEWMARKRQLGREYVSRYIKVKPHILAKVEQFFNDYIKPQYTVGVQIRGTDLAYAEPTKPEAYFRSINQLVADTHQDDFRLFLATDQNQFVDMFQQEFGERVITYSSIRSSSDVPAFLFRDVSPYKKGEDVLIDILLLSKCNYLFKCASAVGEYALWFNPSLECVDFALESRLASSSASAYLKLNIGQLPMSKVLLMVLSKKLMRATFNMTIVIGRHILPTSLRDWLWQSIGRHIYI